MDAIPPVICHDSIRTACPRHEPKWDYPSYQEDRCLLSAWPWNGTDDFLESESSGECQRNIAGIPVTGWVSGASSFTMEL
jgi:hypothetical protein